MESINDFLITGELKTAPFGTEKESVIKMFGKSDHVWTKEDEPKEITIIRYGITEFYFQEPNDNKYLDGVLIQPRLNSVDNLNFKIDLNWVKPNMIYKEIIDILNQHHINYKELTDEIGQNVIKTEGEVVFYFLDDIKNTAERKLDKFGRFKINLNH